MILEENKGRFKKNQIPWNKGKTGIKSHPHSDESRKKISEAHKGIKPWNKGLTYKTGTPSWNKGLKGRMHHTEEHKTELAKRMKGNAYRKNKPSPMKEKNHSKTTKLKISLSRKGKYGGVNHSMYGKHHSESTKIKISQSKMGRGGLIGDKNPMYGKTLSEEHKKKIAEANKGEKSYCWKGGKKLSNARQHNKRKRELGFIPLNSSFKEGVAHHIDRDRIIYIPKQIHQTTNHQLKNIDKMNSINAIAYFFLMQQNINELANNFVAVR